MVKDEFEDDFPEEQEAGEETEYEETEEKIEKRGRPSKPTPSPVSKYKQQPPQEKKAEVKNRFEAYHIAERAGVIDLATEKPVGEDVLSLLAVILNKLQKIEEAVV